MHHLADTLLLSYVLAVATIDGFRHRIPNVVTIPAAAVGLTLGAVGHGAAGLLASSEGLLVGFSVLLPFYFLGGFGAGDVKALAAAGSFLGPHGALEATVCTLILGGIGGTAVLLAVGGLSALQSMLRRWTFGAQVLCSTGHLAALPPPAGDAARLRFPYGIAIACGVAASLLWG